MVGFVRCAAYFVGIDYEFIISELFDSRTGGFKYTPVPENILGK
jgi:hypothetical protein